MGEFYISVPAAPLRSSANDRAEMVTQGLYGQSLNVIEEDGNWVKVRLTDDHYEGWTDRKLIRTKHGQKFEQLITGAIEKHSIQGQSVWLPAGSYLPVTRKEHVALSLTEGARQFLGAPYLWGGKTILGIDCSGLTQVAALIAGVKIPRDACQQAEIGEEVPFADLCKEGDLAFFDNEEGTIIHVGILLSNDHGKWSILHASGEVRIDHFDHQGIFREDFGKYTHKLRIIRRLSFRL